MYNFKFSEILPKPVLKYIKVLKTLVWYLSKEPTDNLKKNNT